MSADWPEVALGSVTTWLSGGTPNKATPSFWNGNIPWISANSMYGTRFNDSDMRITESGLGAGSRLAPTNSVLLLVRGGALHNRLPVGMACRDLAFNQDVKALIADPTRLDPWFLLYWLIGNERFLLDVVVEETGIGAGKLDTKRMQALPIRLPPMDLQQRIAQVAQSIDDKIDLNRRINQTLEAMAQAIFKSWFVDFDPVKAKIAAIAEGSDALRAAMSAISGKPDAELDALPPAQYTQLAATAALFPDEMEESELGEIPRGWAVEPIGELVECVGGATPDTKNSDFWEPAEYAWTTPKDLSGANSPVLLSTERKISSKGVEKIGSGLLPEGTLLMSSRAPIGYLALTKMPVAINQGYIAMPPGGKLPPLYLYFWCKENLSIIKGNANGSTFLEISKKAFRPILALNPSSELLGEFPALLRSVIIYCIITQFLKYLEVSPCLAKSSSGLSRTDLSR